MAVKKMQRTSNRTWHELRVSDREMIVVETPEGRVTISTGYRDINNNSVLSVDILTDPDVKFEYSHGVPQNAKVHVRKPNKVE